MQTLKPEQAKTEQEYNSALAEEKENEAFGEARRMAKSAHRNVRNVGIIKLVHEFGMDIECPCSHCK